MLKGHKNLIQSWCATSSGDGGEAAIILGEINKITDAPSGSDHSVPFLLQWEKCQETRWDSEWSKGCLLISYKTQHEGRPGYWEHCSCLFSKDENLHYFQLHEMLFFLLLLLSPTYPHTHFFFSLLWEFPLCGYWNLYIYPQGP